MLPRVVTSRCHLPKAFKSKRIDHRSLEARDSNQDKQQTAWKAWRKRKGKETQGDREFRNPTYTELLIPYPLLYLRLQRVEHDWGTHIYWGTEKTTHVLKADWMLRKSWEDLGAGGFHLWLTLKLRASRKGSSLMMCLILLKTYSKLN